MVDPSKLVDIEAYEAFRLALELSDKTEADVKEFMNYSGSNCHRIFSMEEYYTSYEKIPKLCKFLGNNIIILWLIAQAENNLDQPRHKKVDCPALLQETAAFFKEASDVGLEASEAVKDSKLEAHELRRVIKELSQVQDKVFSLIGRLRQTERFLSSKLINKA